MYCCTGEQVNSCIGVHIYTSVQVYIFTSVQVYICTSVQVCDLVGLVCQVGLVNLSGVPELRQPADHLTEVGDLVCQVGLVC